AEEGAEAEERRELRIAVDDRVDERAAAARRAVSPGDAAVEDVERAREDREPAGDEDPPGPERRAGEDADAELRERQQVGMDAPDDQLILERREDASIPSPHARSEERRLVAGRPRRNRRVRVSP